MPDLKAIYRRLREVLQPDWDARVAQSVTARRVGVHQGTVSNWWNGKTLGTAKNVAALCESEDVSPSWLLLGAGPKRLSELRKAHEASRATSAADDAVQAVAPPPTQQPAPAPRARRR